MPAFKFVRAGERFGRLTVLTDRTPESRAIVCRCDCGTDIRLTVHRWERTQSCGCLCAERTAQANTTHGLYRHPLYRTWSGMWTRCTNPRSRFFGDYGGRGITVCERWRDFAAFVADMGERPDGLTLDRIDNDRGYEPDNCRWARRAEQVANRRDRRTAAACRNGHPYTDANTYWSPDGRRQCRTCRRAAMNRHATRTSSEVA